MSAVAGSLKRRMLTSGSWSTLGYGSSVALRFISTLVVTRLLMPEVFGVIAIAMMVQLIVNLLADVGISQTVIHSKRGATPELLHTAWTVQVLRGGIVWLVCLTIAAILYYAGRAGVFPADSVYAAPELPAVIAVATLASVVHGFESTSMIAAYRALNLKRRVLLTFGANLVGLIFTIFFAWYLRSVWAFVIGSVMNSVVLTVSSHLLMPGVRMRFRWDAESLRELKGYGTWVLMSSTLWVLAANADRLLLGGWVDPATLGLYSLAFTLAKMLSDAGEHLFSSVAMPAMSEKARESEQALARLYFRVRMPFDTLFLVGAGFLFSTGQLIVDILYDDRYAGAGRMLQALSCMLLFARYAIAFNAYLAMGKPRYYFYVNVTKLLSILTVLPLAYIFFGVEAAVWAIGLHMAPVVPLVFWLNRRHGLNNFRFEALVLLAWPVGYYIGELANMVVRNA
jgi:O-antigen/teichoic acid export membrane protein